MCIRCRRSALRLAPPGLVGAIPLDRSRQAGIEVGVHGLPAELPAQLGRIDRVAEVVARTVRGPVEVVLGPSERTQDRAYDRQVVALPVRTDEIRLAQAPARKDRPHGGAVVVHMDPIAHVAAIAVQLRTAAVDNAGDLTRDELLHMLPRPVVVRAVGYGRAQPVGAHPGAHQHVGRRLRRAVGARGPVRRVLGEPVRPLERQVAEHLIGGHVVVSDPVPAACLDHRVSPADVRIEKSGR